MQKLKYIVILLSLNIYLEANYCVQVMTSSISDKRHIINTADSYSYNAFNDVRVETRGAYLVFRIGDYRNYIDAKHDIYEIKKINRDAYIRKCDFVKDKAIYIKHETRERNNYRETAYESEPDTRGRERYYPRETRTRKNHRTYDTDTRDSSRHQTLEYGQKYIEPIPRRRESEYYQKYDDREVSSKRNDSYYQKPQNYDERSTVTQTDRNYEQKVVQDAPTEREELTYTNDNSLWGDCKKCFIPAYEEGEEVDPSYEEPKKETKVKVNQQWESDEMVEESVPVSKRVVKRRNRFNIDEQYLP